MCERELKMTRCSRTGNKDFQVYPNNTKGLFSGGSVSVHLHSCVVVTTISFPPLSSEHLSPNNDVVSSKQSLLYDRAAILRMIRKSQHE